VTSCFYHELLLLKRRSHVWIYPICFFAVMICLFPLAFTPDPIFLQKYIPGCIWLAALLAGLLSVENIFLADMEDGYLEQLLLSDTPLSFTVLIKMCAQWLVTELPLILLTPLLGLMFDLPLHVIIALCASLLVGTPALLMIGALVSALTIGMRQQGAILGLLILPLVTPILIFGVNITQQAQAGFSILPPLAFLAGISLLAVMLIPWGIAAALKIGLDD